MKRLEGKRAIVTGAASGIGREAALLFAAEGARVIATDVKAGLLDPLEGLPGLQTRRLDVLDDAAIKACAAEIGPVDVLFNCAGFVHHGNIIDCTDEDWDLAFNLNVRAMYVTIKAMLPAMLATAEKSGSASIVNISSIASSVQGLPNRCAYGASKAAVVGLTKSVARDFVRKGIRCNAVCPGTIDTPILEPFGDEGRKALTSAIPRGTMGRPEEIAGAATFLASDDASFVNGVELFVDGGTAQV